MTCLTNFGHNKIFPQKIGFITFTYLLNFKGCVRYIFASLFFKFKQEHLPN